MKKIIVGMIIMVMFVLTACSGEGKKAEDKKVLIVGLDDTFAPMGFREKESGELVGFDVELAKRAGELMGYEIKFQPIDWSVKETELQTKKIDLIWNGYTITEKRKEQVAFTDSYLKNRQVIVTMNGSQITSKADLIGKTVSLQAMSSALEAVQKDEEFVKNLKDGQVIEFATNEDAFHDLEAGRSDAIVVDEVLARYYVRQNGEGKYFFLEENFGEEEFGIGLRKEDTELLSQLNTALKTMKDDGSYDKAYKTWFAGN